ncbi:hypothetical protein HELRODRAFT_107437 [Helobdella robusta]|uniref:Tetratricopeptide repeat protein 7 N-terminal domain-containing protein n=1 Tax=Helobdella robusta TaxID=6412 RepID=T1EEA6_HELRO|nr:hypothetical protein HELRODRAFT_107437 [Helobdella robusta]ESN96277.1 hypothetical protein HELRODRAFT_107437 [Helobdella robusta]
MAGKTYKTGKLESDIDRLRAEGNWPRLLDMSKQIATKAPAYETLSKYLQTECKVERYLLDNPVTFGSSSNNATSSTMNTTATTASYQEPDMKHETLMLMAKLHYSLNELDKVLNIYHEIGLDALQLQDISSRKLKLIGEAFSLKGICLERQLTASHMETSQPSEIENEIIHCYEKSGNISLFQLIDRQERWGSKMGGVSGTGVVHPVSDVDNVGLSPMVEHAIQRSPLLYIRRGELDKGINRFRDLLRVVEVKATQGMRQTLARQLAEVLMRGVCRASYTPIQLLQQQQQQQQHDPHDFNILKLKKFASDKLFIPKDENEETLLLLLISESIATREVVLNRSQELSQARSHTLHNATSVYDLLTICLARKSQYHLLSETFEKAMKFSFNEFHIWFQFVLSLVCSQKFSRAYFVLKECMKLSPENPTLYMMAAKLCYEHLNLVDDGIKHSEEVIRICSSSSSSSSSTASHSNNPVQKNPMLETQKSLFHARGHLFLGIGYSLKREELKMLTERQMYQKMSIEAFKMSISIDSSDHLAYFHMAYQMAVSRKIVESLSYVRTALQLRRDHLQSLHLLVLLLTSQKQYEEASKLIEATLVEYPDDFSLLFTKCKLDVELGLAEVALQTCRHMLQLWKSMFECIILDTADDRVGGGGGGTGLLERITNDHQSLLHLQYCEVADRDSGSTRAESVAASRLEQNLWEVASSLGSNLQPRSVVPSGPQQAILLQAQIWLLLAELYLKLKKLDSAQACIQEAGTLCPMSHVVSYMRGRYLESKGMLNEARKVYENAISINPSHVRSMLRLGIVLHRLGNDRLAETTLRNAVSSDPTSSMAWRTLGQVLESLGDSKVASECLVTSLDLEATDPILPFSIVQRTCS